MNSVLILDGIFETMLSSSTQYSAERSKNRFSAIKSESNNPIKVNLKNLSQRVIEMVNSGWNGQRRGTGGILNSRDRTTAELAPYLLGKSA